LVGLVKGDVVVVPFPFSDLSTTKRRPALVVATLGGSDVILCQITSRTVSDGYAVPLVAADFATGNLREVSNIRPNRLFTADANLVLYRVGTLRPAKLAEVVARLIEIFRQ
jgi:mRNA-degrading endonuclease toxin of MazEF toxin-antitoxin module